MSRSSDSSSHSQDEDRRAPGVMIRGIGEYVKHPPPAPVISQFGKAFVEPHPLPPSTPTRKRELESPQFRASHYASEDLKRRRRRHSPSLPPHGYSRSYESSRSSTPPGEEDDSEEIIDEPKKIKDFRKLVEDQKKEKREVEERHENELKTAITASAQEIIHFEGIIKKREDKIVDLKKIVDDLRDDLKKSEDDLREKENERWALKVVFEDTNKDYEKLQELYKKQEDDLRKSETTIKRLVAEKLKLVEDNDNLKKQKDEAMKKQAESENRLDAFRKNVEQLQEELKKETADFNKTKAELVESQKEVKTANEKLINVEKELSEVAKSDKESKENLVKAAEEYKSLEKENTDLKASLTLQSTENDMLKEKLARLEETNKKLSVAAAQANRSMNGFVHGFMEKYKDEQASSRSNLQEWFRTTKKRLNISDTDSDMPGEEKSTTHINPKCERSREQPEGEGVMNILKIIMKTISENDPEASFVGKRKTIGPNATTTTEEIPLISSSTPHNSVDMAHGYQSSPQVGNAIATQSPSTNISQRDVSDKTIKTSPSTPTSRGPAALAQDNAFFLSLSPIPQNRSMENGSRQATVSPSNTTHQTCPWCKKEFPSKIIAAKHVCENPRDPRMVRQQQKKP